MFRSFLLALAILLTAPEVSTVIVPGSGDSAEAAKLRYKIRSTYPQKLYLEFYGQKWNHIWPGGGEV